MLRVSGMLNGSGAKLSPRRKDRVMTFTTYEHFKCASRQTPKEERSSDDISRQSALTITFLFDLHDLVSYVTELFLCQIVSFFN